MDVYMASFLGGEVWKMLSVGLTKKLDPTLNPSLAKILA
jgi:hypothetical protein